MDMRRFIWLWIMMFAGRAAFAQCGGLDIFIANDQSGSVDANENLKSREFLSAFAQILPLSANPGGYRIAIADWDLGGWKQYQFPVAGVNFTTQLSDVLYYSAAPRVLYGGTDLVMALQNAYIAITQDPSDRPKVILLMTDAMMGVVNPALIELAEQIKSNGIYIAILSIDTPFNPILADAASPDGYFLADSYEQLSAEAASFTASIGAALCQGSLPSFDLDIRLTNFYAENCFPGPGTYTLTYEIKNHGKLDWDAVIDISLYDGDLYQYGSKLIDVFATPKIKIAPGETYSATYSNASLASFSKLAAIVNFNGGNGNLLPIPVYPFELYPLLTVTGERTSINNYSALINRTNGNDCTPIANIIVDVKPENAACGNITSYTVDICNQGSQDARIENFYPEAHSSFRLVQADVQVENTRTSHANTYFGGMIADYAYAASTDPFGSIYIAGQTNSTNNIATPGAHRPSNGNTQDAFLAKFNAGGERLWATYFGGTGPENGYSVTTDKEGNVYLTGETSISTNLSTAGSHQPSNGGNYDAYLARFSANGALLWSTYYGGTGADYGRSVATDDEGNVYLAGITASNNMATPGAHQPTPGGGNDAFLAKFNKDGVRQWSTYYGGSGTESGFGVAVDANGYVYLTGITGSVNNIASPGSYQPVKAAGNDAYLAKFDKNGVRQWGTYFGGNNSDNATAIATDAMNRIYIAGNTASTDLPAASGFQSSNGGGTDAFAVQFNADGTVNWATYYGNTGTENGRHIHASKDGFVYLSGNTTSNIGIATAGSIQETYGGNTDAFLVKLTTNGARVWGTYFGGTANDISSAAVTDAAGKVYLTGATQSTGLATPGSHQETYGGGGNDAFLLSIDEKNSFILKSGNCVQFHYYYDVSAAAAGNYDFSFHIKAAKFLSSDPEPAVKPDPQGFSGQNHTIDDVTVQQQAPACAAGDKLSIAVDIPPVTICGEESYVTATLTINNTSGIMIRDALLNLSLTGTSARFSGELYNASTGLRYARADMLNPLYPAVDHALSGKTGNITVPVYEIPAGTSTIKINMVVNGSDLVLATHLSEIGLFFNPSGKTTIATSNNSVTLSALPTISGWNYPSTITAGNNILINGITTTNAHSLFWASSVASPLAGTGFLSQPELVYQPSAAEIANGFADISLTVLNAIGCDVSAAAHITIVNVHYDYGDAAISYDAGQQTIPVAAGATTLTGIHLGKTAPTTEASAHSGVNADGDGVEEDALADRCPAVPEPGKNYIVKINATNRSPKDGFIGGFIDWNNDGDFLDEAERAVKAIKATANSGENNYLLSFNVPAGAMSRSRYMVRLRISSDSMAASKPFGASPEGEVEDHWLAIGEKKIIYQQKTICKGTAFTVGQNHYTAAGNYIDVLTALSGCDSTVHTTLKVDVCGDDVCGPFIPSAFTPNNDGKNDEFGAIVHCAVSQFRLSIYNRWGQKVFETTNPSDKWNGTFNGQLQPAAVFTWQCIYTREGIQQLKKGTVTLVR